jgi:hypothetical protein
MVEVGHDSAESAAMVGFPKAHCRVVASRMFEDDAYVLLDTGSPGQPYLYGSTCYRRGGQWFEAGSSNAHGWEQTSDGPLGTLSFWGDAPDGIERCESSSTARSRRSQFGTAPTFLYGGACPLRLSGHVLSQSVKAAPGNRSPSSDYRFEWQVSGPTSEAAPPNRPLQPTGGVARASWFETIEHAARG